MTKQLHTIQINTRQNKTSQSDGRKPKIIGGNNVEDPNRYPYFALMNGSGLCGAVLISKRFVLTAAHCVGSDNDFEIGISEMDSFIQSWFSESDSGGTEYPYKRGFVHPNYDDDTLHNDIAIYELEQDVPENLPYIRLEQYPVKIPGTQMTVVGFGDTDPSEFIDVMSDYLLETTVDYVSKTDCIDRMGAGEIGPDMLCAFEEGEDTCQGDSGGPLFLKGDNVSEDSLVGLVSWGYSCAGDTPGVYTRISYFYDWIVDTMCFMNPDGVPDYVDCNSISNGSGSGGDEIIVPPETQPPSFTETTSSSTGFGESSFETEPPSFSDTTSSSMGFDDDDDLSLSFDDDNYDNGSFISESWQHMKGWFSSLFGS
jgi:trypsin